MQEWNSSGADTASGMGRSAGKVEKVEEQIAALHVSGSAQPLLSKALCSFALAKVAPFLQKGLEVVQPLQLSLLRALHSKL